MTQYDIYGIGAALLDTEIQVTDQDLKELSVEKGIMTLVDQDKQQQLIHHLDDHITQSKRTSGGSAANTIIASSYFGAKTFYSCRVSNDDNGKLYLNDLGAANVQYHSNNGSFTGITGKCLVLITPDAERSMNTFLGISEQLCIDDIDEAALAQSKYVYLEGYLATSETGRAAAIKLRELAEENNVKTAITLSDPAIVQFFKDNLKAMIGPKGVDLLFCNQDEAFNFTETDNIEEALNELQKYAKAFAITLGAEGALLFDGAQTIKVPGYKVEAIDSNGAGDMFAGAFLAELSKGKSFEACGNLGCKAASVVVSQYGPRLKPEQHIDILKEITEQ